MKIQSIRSHEQAEVTMPGAQGARIRMLIGPNENAPNFHMRHYEVAPKGFTPHHSHDFEHEMLVLKGRGTARTVQGDRPIQAGDVVFVPANEMHQFLNDGPETLEFICLIPAPKSCCV